MKYYEDKSDRKMELKLLSLSEDDKLIRECMEQASAFYGCLGEMGVKEILCDRKKAQELGADCQITGIVNIAGAGSASGNGNRRGRSDDGGTDRL